MSTRVRLVTAPTEVSEAFLLGQLSCDPGPGDLDQFVGIERVNLNASGWSAEPESIDPSGEGATPRTRPSCSGIVRRNAVSSGSPDVSDSMSKTLTGAAKLPTISSAPSGVDAMLQPS